jgi:hypothetical protein
MLIAIVGIIIGLSIGFTIGWAICLDALGPPAKN